MADPVEEFAAEMEALIEADQDREWATYPEWIRKLNKANQKAFNAALMAQIKKAYGPILDELKPIFTKD